ncbi:MAG: 16S rRNA (uracil(1498)-N(3))-methyltransferase [Rhodospirillaceae bacterium]
MTRIYFPDRIAEHGVCELHGEQAHYLTRVLRVEPGDALVLFDGRGGEYPATVTAIARSVVRLNVAERIAVSRESPLAIHIAQGISSGDRMDYTVQKAVELGVTRIQPLATERSVVHLDQQRAAKRVAHWQSIAVAACAQCGRNEVPAIAPVMDYRTWLGGLESERDVRLMLSPLAANRLHDLKRPAGAVWLLCGPEGGLAPVEQRDAEQAGFHGVRLGPRVLRTETAAVAALAAMQALWGDF